MIMGDQTRAPVMRHKLFSVSIRDCRVDTFRAGGKGGQNQNKVESGVRIVHVPSGAVGEARDSRDQLQNKRNAFRRMAESRVMQRWIRVKAHEIVTGQSIAQRVDKDMAPENLKIEVRSPEGWIDASV